MATDISVSQLHPSVTSVITSTPSTYVSNTSQTTLFCADTFECGVDNHIQKISSVTEFIEKFGEPNMSKYGQGAYNVIRWLEAGGDAFILRVLPNDAKFAHAVLNVKTKSTTETKEVVDYTGNIVKLNDVFLKPVISYIDVNATSEDALEAELEKTRSDTSLDGYKDNFIFVAYPNGRGDYYNKLGFMISPNKSFDNVYDSKIYDFTVITFDENGNYAIVEGPFNVSFDPNALASSNESLFIEDVVNKYSEKVKIKFSTDNYLKVAELINPDVNPYKVDILKGQTRLIDDVPETYFNEKTGQSEDLHIALHAYSDGEAMIVNGEQKLNIDTDTTTTEKAILALDNSFRKQSYNDVNVAVLAMKDAYSDVLKDKYNDSIQALKTKVDNDIDSINTDKYTKDVKGNEDTSEEPATIGFEAAMEKEVKYLEATAKYNSGAYIDDIHNKLTSEQIYLLNCVSIFDINLPAESETERLSAFFEKYINFAILKMDGYERTEYFADLARIFGIVIEGKEQSEIEILVNAEIASLDMESDYFDRIKEDINTSVEANSVYTSDNFVNQININDLDKVYDSLMNVVTDVKTTLSYYDIMGDNSNIVVITALKVQLDKIISQLYQTDKNNLRLSINRENILKVANLVDKYANSTDITEKYNGCVELIATLEGIFNSIKNLYIEDVSTQATYEKFVEVINNNLNTAKELLKELDYITAEDINTNYKVIFNLLINTYDNLNSMASFVVTMVNYKIIIDLAACNFPSDEETVSIKEFIENLVADALEIYQDPEFDIKTKPNIPIIIETKKLEVVSTASNVYSNNLQDFDDPIKFNNGSDGSFAVDIKERKDNIKNLLIKAYKGLVDNSLLNSNLVEFNHILDANYDPAIKAAIVTLARDIRKDFFFWVDTNIQASVEDTLNWRRNEFNQNSYFVGIFAQDFIYYDEYTGRDCKFTTPYVLAEKIPYCASQYGLQFPIAGNLRGLVDGYKKLSWTPNENEKESLYLKKINYIEEDPRRTRIGSQSTAEAQTSPLSNINNVLTLLDIKKNIERIVEDYQFEFNDSETQSALQAELSTYLSRYISNRSCESINVTVTASDYDKIQKIIRVSASIKFNKVIERIIISLDVAE